MTEIGNIKLHEGTMQILEEMKKLRSVRFKDLENLTNPRTKRKYSPNTLSNRLKELEKYGLAKETIVKSDKGRIISYIITDNGIQFLDTIKKAENIIGSKK